MKRKWNDDFVQNKETLMFVLYGCSHVNHITVKYLFRELFDRHLFDFVH